MNPKIKKGLTIGTLIALLVFAAWIFFQILFCFWRRREGWRTELLCSQRLYF